MHEHQASARAHHARSDVAFVVRERMQAPRAKRQALASRRGRTGARGSGGLAPSMIAKPRSYGADWSAALEGDLGGAGRSRHEGALGRLTTRGRSDRLHVSQGSRGSRCPSARCRPASEKSAFYTLGAQRLGLAISSTKCKPPACASRPIGAQSTRRAAAKIRLRGDGPIEASISIVHATRVGIRILGSSTYRDEPRLSSRRGGDNSRAAAS